MEGEYLDEFDVNATYAVFGRKAFFDKNRDDEMPIDRNGKRDAQRRLFSLLLQNDANRGLVVSEPHCPPSVRLRDSSASRCFDLSELVRDCNCDLDLAREPTPPSMEENGLKLREYQQSSLRWMLDKERETTGLGNAGEL